MLMAPEPPSPAATTWAGRAHAHHAARILAAARVAYLHGQAAAAGPSRGADEDTLAGLADGIWCAALEAYHRDALCELAARQQAEIAAAPPAPPTSRAFLRTMSGGFGTFNALPGPSQRSYAEMRVAELAAQEAHVVEEAARLQAAEAAAALWARPDVKPPEDPAHALPVQLRSMSGRFGSYNATMGPSAALSAAIAAVGPHMPVFRGASFSRSDSLRSGMPPPIAERPSGPAALLATDTTAQSSPVSEASGQTQADAFPPKLPALASEPAAAAPMADATDGFGDFGTYGVAPAAEAPVAATGTDAFGSFAFGDATAPVPTPPPLPTVALPVALNDDDDFTDFGDVLAAMAPAPAEPAAPVAPTAAPAVADEDDFGEFGDAAPLPPPQEPLPPPLAAVAGDDDDFGDFDEADAAPAAPAAPATAPAPPAAAAAVPESDLLSASVGDFYAAVASGLRAVLPAQLFSHAPPADDSTPPPPLQATARLLGAAGGGAGAPVSWVQSAVAGRLLSALSLGSSDAEREADQQAIMQDYLAGSSKIILHARSGSSFGSMDYSHPPEEPAGAAPALRRGPAPPVRSMSISEASNLAAAAAVAAVAAAQQPAPATSGVSLPSADAAATAAAPSASGGMLSAVGGLWGKWAAGGTAAPTLAPSPAPVAAVPAGEASAPAPTALSSAGSFFGPSRGASTASTGSTGGESGAPSPTTLATAAPASGEPQPAGAVSGMASMPAPAPAGGLSMWLPAWGGKSS